MLINKEQINLIKENKVTLIKNFVRLDKTYDYNFISEIIEKNDLCIENKSSFGHLRDVFHIQNVIDTSKEFRIFFDFLSKLLKYEKDKRDGVDLFFSFTSQVGGPHVDIEDVFIIGLKGQIIYRIFDVANNDYYINSGDMIFIPRGIKHKVIGISPRIVASIGFYGISNG
jgi:mannose-6-phosphate isomerase-like protein (cupin superfamily)